MLLPPVSGGFLAGLPGSGRRVGGVAVAVTFAVGSLTGGHVR
jgi:hypothetical protein